MKISIQPEAMLPQWGKETAYRMVKDAGFEAVEWNLEMGLPCGEIRAGRYRGVSIYEKGLEAAWEEYGPHAELIHNTGLTITQAHAPFPAYVPGYPDSQEFMIGILKVCIQICHRAHCKNLIIHGNSLALTDRNHTQKDIDRMNWELYTAFIPLLRETDVTVCLENLFTNYKPAKYSNTMLIPGICKDPWQAADLIDRLNKEAGKECFGLCLDTGHLQIAHGDFRTYIPVLGKRIKALHIHDNDGVQDLHRAPYTGTICWKDFYEALGQIGYDGDLNFETIKQTTTELLDPELVAPWLDLIYKTGVHFRSKIEAIKAANMN